ncbi:MAG: ferredoxin [Rhodospirillaceae bacterium]|nr:ferredoxin [Rhodospirillaceae bacterium]
MASETLNRIESTLASSGLILRGAFHPERVDAVPARSDGHPTGTLVLIGNAGPEMFAAFTRDVASDPDIERPDPLDTWTREKLAEVSKTMDAEFLHVSDGPPYHPFQRWAMRAEGLKPSPIGVLVHPEFGPWHAYRGALLLAEKLDIPPPPDLGTSPCETCEDKPCQTTCPVWAIGGEIYDVPVCARHVSTEGIDCRDGGCLARRACPVGWQWAYEEKQARFHMSAFLTAHGGS